VEEEEVQMPCMEKEKAEEEKEEENQEYQEKLECIPYKVLS